MADDEVQALMRSHEPALLRLAFLLCHDAARAEDLVQDTFVRVLRHYRAGRTPSFPIAYARQILINEYLAWRRRRASAESIGQIDEIDKVGIEDAADRLADRDLVWRLLAGLSPRSRAVLVLRYYEQLPDAEIASIIGCREATVRSVAARGLHALRDHPMLSHSLEEA